MEINSITSKVEDEQSLNSTLQRKLKEHQVTEQSVWPFPIVLFGILPMSAAEAKEIAWMGEVFFPPLANARNGLFTHRDNTAPRGEGRKWGSFSWVLASFFPLRTFNIAPALTVHVFLTGPDRGTGGRT